MLDGSIPGVGDRISRVVLGSDTISSARLDQATSVLETFVAAGGTAIDAARSYANGASEAAIGVWLRGRGRRDDLTIITKGAHPDSDELPRVTPPAIECDLAQSLEALQIDQIDLYLLHRDDMSKPVGPIVETLNIDLAGFVAGSPNLAVALIGPRTVSELEDCLGVLEVELTAPECSWLNLEDGPPLGKQLLCPLQ